MCNPFTDLFNQNQKIPIVQINQIVQMIIHLRWIQLQLLLLCQYLFGTAEKRWYFLIE